MASSQKQLRVGIVGAGEVAQVIHLPVLALLSHLYSVTIVCDLSKKNAEHCAQKFHIPKATTDPEEVFKSGDVDVVFVLTSDEFHAPYTIAALEAGKDVMIEKPITLSIAAAQRIIDAEAKSGRKVFVGYVMNLLDNYNIHAETPLDICVATLPHSRMHSRESWRRSQRSSTLVLVTLAVVSTITCHCYEQHPLTGTANAQFVNQSGTFQVKNTDFPSNAGTERMTRLDELMKDNFGPNPTDEQVKYCRFLGSLGSHDLSLMREALGFPEAVVGVTVNDPFYSAMFKMRNKSGEPYFVTYESGIDGVPEFDAHLAVYGENKRVSIQYDSPYVKGLPIKVKVQELNEAGEFQTREILSSYEDAYTSELQEMYECLVNGKAIKTTAADAMNELKLYSMMYEKYDADAAK